MKNLITITLIVALLISILPDTGADLDKWNDGTTATVTLGTVNSSSLLVGSIAVSRGTLTHAAGNVIVDFSQTNRYWSCTITGNVSVVPTNAAVGKWANILFFNTQATNCTPTFPFVPAGSTTNWFGGAPSTLTAGTVGSLSLYCIDATTNSTKAAYAETQ